MEASMESSIVIKVKFGDTLRRFNTRVVDNEKLELNMEALRNKILKLFSLDPEADFVLKYTDCDGDVVTLVDDNDLNDVMMQRLNPFRIEVAQMEEGSVKSYSGSIGSSTPRRSPNFQDQLSVVNEEELNAVQVMLPEPVPADALSGEIADFFPRSGQSSNNQLSQVEKFSSTDNRASEKSRFLSDEIIMRFSRSIVDTRPIESTSGNTGKNVIPASRSVDISPLCPVVSCPLPPPPSPYGLEPADMFPDASNVSAFNNENNQAKEGDDQLDRGTTNSKFPLDEAMKKLSQIIPYKRPIENASGNTGKNVIPVTASVNLNTPSPAVSHPLPCPPLEDAHKFPYESNVPAFDKKKHTERGHESQPNDTALSAGSYAAPSSGTPAADESASTTSPSDGTLSVHSGIICDGCDAYPITGPRFKSKGKDYYDLCSICFSKMSKEEEYVRIDHPFSFPSVSQKLLNDPVWCSRQCMPLSPLKTLSVPPPPANLDWDSCFVLDVNVKDDNTIAPSTPFTKVWRVLNTGNLSWPQGSRVEWIGGDKLSAASAVEIEVPWDDLPTGEEVNIEVDFTAPEKPGNYISLWRLVSPSGQFFGENIWVEIEVEGHQKDSPRQICRSFDLNLPPCGRKGLKDPAIIGSNIEQISKPFSSNRIRKRVQTTFGKKTSYDKTMSFKKNNASSNPEMPYSHEGTSLIGKIATISPSTSSDEGAPGDIKIIEQMLMSDLEDMGFDQIDLNKKVLRKNDYDIDEAVKDLIAAVKWDPAIEELENMGFLDAEMNKSMLLKHDGCLWSALMDLIDAYGVTDCVLWGDE